MKRTYLQQLAAIAKRAHTWALVVPISQVAETVGNHQHITYHPSVRY